MMGEILGYNCTKISLKRKDAIVQRIIIRDNGVGRKLSLLMTLLVHHSRDIE